MNGTAEIITDSLPSGWQWRKLGEICQVNPRRPSNLQLDANRLTTFVPMVAVDATSGTISDAETKLFSEVSRGYTYFEEEDVLFAKITPCMENGKHTIARNLVHGIGFGTTEFHVVRPSPKIIPEWVHKYLRQQRILLQAKKHFRGAVGQQRLPKEFLADLPIPLPPLAEQERIVRILDDKLAVIDKAKQAAETQLEATNALPGAYLREQIPSYEDSLPNGWRQVPLKVVLHLHFGTRITKKKDEGVLYPVYGGGGESFRTDTFNRENDVVISRFAMSSECVRFVNEKFFLLDSGCTFSILESFINDAYKPFVAYGLLSKQGEIYTLARGQAQKNLDVKAFMELYIPLPPLAEQERIVRILDEKLAAIDKAKQASNTRLDTINAMSAAYLRRAFAGEL